MTKIVLLGTCDTKLDELLYLRDRIISHPGIEVTLLDVGRTPVHHNAIDIAQSKLSNQLEIKQDGSHREIASLPRGELIQHMARCATKYVRMMASEGSIHGVVAAGGSGGTSLASAVMRDALPIGIPKLIVSTVASGDTGPIVGETDITLMYSVVDVAGLSSLLRAILTNAAGAIVGMAKASETQQGKEVEDEQKRKTRVGITMFGVTTPGVDAMRHYLEEKYDVEVYVFHATGHGGTAMERLINEGRLDAVVDLTTTEICDHLVGGNMSAGPARLEAAAKAGIPNIVSLGATDMVNFGPKATLPQKCQGRKLFEHNPLVTLMRTSEEECRQVGAFIVEKLTSNAVEPGMVQVWIPAGGVSMLAVPGASFADERADRALFDTLKDGLTDSGIEVVYDDRQINDEGLAHAIADQLMRMVKNQNG